jgi:hypothetical protein
VTETQAIVLGLLGFGLVGFAALWLFVIALDALAEAVLDTWRRRRR